MDDPPVVSQEEWLAARTSLLAKEKVFTQQRDALNAERRSRQEDWEQPPGRSAGPPLRWLRHDDGYST